jgi:hypothetical protein
MVEWYFATHVMYEFIFLHCIHSQYRMERYACLYLIL